ncbi:MAG: response regulator [Sphingobacteriales bacterium]|nr:MAG: response regulator [Sphingobacteriales bacterium]
MALSGPILIIEDDHDDQELIKLAITEMKIENEIRIFNNGKEALDYLLEVNEQPFLMLCDVNMPIMNGLELRDYIENDERLKKKSIPFVFFTTAANKSIVNKAYDLTIQGFYQKEDTYTKLAEQLNLIVRYWKSCLHPNRYIL